MDFGEAIANGLRNYATFQGRASRSEFWWWSLFGFLVTSVADIVDAGVDPHTKMVGALVGLALLLPGLAVTVRRLHDVGRSGWWWWIGLTIIGFFVPLLVWFCRRGEPHPNAYGPDPLGLDAGPVILPR